MRSSYTPFLTDWQSNPTYRNRNFRGGPTRKHAKFLNPRKFCNRSTKEEDLIKSLSIGKIPTVPVMVVNTR